MIFKNILASLRITDLRGLFLGWLLCIVYVGFDDI